jgi:glycolate oxidase
VTEELRERARLACAAVLGDAGVLADAASIAEFSQDLVEWEDAPPALLVVRPRSTEQVAAVVRIAAGLDLAVAPRG